MGIASAGNHKTRPIDRQIYIVVQLLFDGRKGSERRTCYNRYIGIRQVVRDFPGPSTITERAPFAQAADLRGGLAHVLAAACPFGIRYPCQTRGNATAHNSVLLCNKI